MAGALAASPGNTGPTVTQADGAVYFDCRYDFKGDRVFPVVFFFTEDGVMKRLFATTGDD